LPRRWPLACLAIVLGCHTASREEAGHGQVGLSQLSPGVAQNGRLDAGPVAQASPPGANVPRDEQQLREWLADPAGPSDIWLPERVWHGDLLIRRTVTLHGAGPGTVLRGTGTATVVDIEGDGVTLENLTIAGSGDRHTSEDAGVRVRGNRDRLARLFLDGVLFGASLEGCTDCVAERLHIVGREGLAEVRGDGIKVWESHGSTVRHCLVERSRDLVVWYSRHVTLDGNVVSESRYGTHFMYAHDTLVKNSTVTGNTVGIFVMYSARVLVEGNVLSGAKGAAGVGLGFKDSDSVTVRGNWIVGNTSGMYIDQTPRRPEEPLLIEGNVIALNGVGLRMHAQPRGVRVVANDLHENAEVARVDGGGDATTATWSNNYWSDYAGFDLDDDGTGDVAWQIKRLSSELTDRHPALRLFGGTAALATLDAVSRAVPVLATRLLLADPLPAMQPHLLDGARG
jgi:nitrous oxidase accessory protein